jgi:carboxyl-terminal processing protease
MRGYSFAISLAAIGALLTVNPVWAGYTPQSLYDDVWKLINTRFVDVNKNQQEWGIWRHRYDKYLETNQDAYVAIESMLASLDDRYTRFLDPDEFAEEGRSIKATLFGIGIQIGTREDKLLIIAPIEDTPADKAGLKANDEILEIDGKSAKGMSVKDAADLIRGEKGSQVKLMIKRGEQPPKMVSVLRDEIKLKSVSVKTPFDLSLPKNVGYIRLSSFLSTNASTELKAAMKDMGPKDGYIIDLRSNPGGLLSNAISIADFFLSRGSIVSTVDRDGYKEVRYSNPTLVTDKPLVLLIDEGSASASEILSGALKDNNRALLVGHRSFGKGLVQEINQLPGGAGINITTQRYLTPNDTDINKTGIEPDLKVDIAEEDLKGKQDPQLNVAVKALNEMIKGRSLKAVIQDKDALLPPKKPVSTAANKV